MKNLKHNTNSQCSFLGTKTNFYANFASSRNLKVHYVILV